MRDMQWHSFAEIKAKVPWWCHTEGALNQLLMNKHIVFEVRPDDTYYKGSQILEAIIELGSVIRSKIDELDKKSFWES